MAVVLRRVAGLAPLVRALPARSGARGWHLPLSTAAGTKGPNTGMIVDVRSAADFDALVMAASAKPPPVGGPVLLDLHADWCQPCKQLTPKLEALVHAARGAVRLAKLDVDELPELAQALQVKSLPTVLLVHKGKLVDQFQGVPADAQLQQFVQKAIALAGGGAQGLKALEGAAELLAAGDVAEASAAYKELLQLPELAASALAGLALCSLKQGQLAAAHELVAELHKAYPADLNKPDVRKAISAVRLAADAPADGEGRSVEDLRAELERNPKDHATRFELANVLLRQEDHDAAVSELLHIIKWDKAFTVEGAEGSKSVRDFTLQIFEALGSDHDVTKKGRRRLANILLM